MSAQIVVGIDTSEHLHFLNDFRRQLLYIGFVGTICLMFLGWFAAWRGLRPVQKMAKVAEGISAQHLSERLEVENTPTELRSLAIAFNDMLDRLESAVEKLSDFSSDLAHEIRTPINNLMTQTQVCLSRSRDINTYQEVLFSNLEEFERLARMVSDMLFLAKAEHGLHLPNLQRLI
jgi:two-component system heavy metal sensor histidine kinase CusS